MNTAATRGRDAAVNFYEERGPRAFRLASSCLGKGAARSPASAATPRPDASMTICEIAHGRDDDAGRAYGEPSELHCHAQLQLAQIRLCRELLARRFGECLGRRLGLLMREPPDSSFSTNFSVSKVSLTRWAPQGRAANQNSANCVGARESASAASADVSGGRSRSRAANRPSSAAGRRSPTACARRRRPSAIRPGRRRS